MAVGNRVQAFNKSGTLYHATIYRVIDGGKKYKVDWDDCDPAGRVVTDSDVIQAMPKYLPSGIDRFRMEERQRRRDEGDSSSEWESELEPELKEEKRQPSPAKKTRSPVAKSRSLAQRREPEAQRQPKARAAASKWEVGAEVLLPFDDEAWSGSVIAINAR